ncbi:hypothetical protein AB1N83_004043 [Pleurotus pulmonarius]
MATGRTEKLLCSPCAQASISQAPALSGSFSYEPLNHDDFNLKLASRGPSIEAHYELSSRWAKYRGESSDKSPHDVPHNISDRSPNLAHSK